MRDDEPLEGWLFKVQLFAEHGRLRYPKGTSREALDRLAQALAAQPEGKVNYDRIRGGTISVYATHWFSSDETIDAQAHYLQVWERGGSGASHVAEGLLQSIALALQPASVPFWRQLLDLSRPRDQSTTRRRTMALAALALLALERDEAEAYAALADALAHSHEQVRALAAFYLAQAYAVPERELPPPVEELLVRLATHDRAFAPRFQARRALRTLGLVPKHQFIYFFDYGDSHEFIVTILGIEKRADDGDYPRVIEAKGKAPRQYRGWDEGDEDEA